MLKFLRSLFGKRDIDVKSQHVSTRSQIAVTVRTRHEPRSGPTPPEKRLTVYRSEYLPREKEQGEVNRDKSGLPDLRLIMVRDTLVLESPTGHWINPYSPAVRKLDITIFRVRGVTFHHQAVKIGDFSPWSSVHLKREPWNEHDPNAIAVYAERARALAGYVNKQNAKRLAKRIDAGESLKAISMRGGTVGDQATPTILVSTPTIISHLTAERM